jgi:hypothetical protein
MIGWGMCIFKDFDVLDRRHRNSQISMNSLCSLVPA